MTLCRTYSIAGRFAIATLLWASLTAPTPFAATAQDSTPMATPESRHSDGGRSGCDPDGRPAGDADCNAHGGARRAADRRVR